MRLLRCIAFALAATPAFASEPCPEAAPMIEAIHAAVERRPDDASLHYYLAGQWARCGDAAHAVAALKQAAERGDGYVPVRAAGFETIWNDAAFVAQRERMAAASPRVVDAEVAYRLSDPQMLPEGIAFDAKTQALFVGSIRSGEIRRVDAGGETVFADRDDGLEQVLGLFVDARQRRLYAVTTSVLMPPDEPVANAVVVFGLDDGTRIARLDADAGQLNDVVVADDGTVYATDSQAGGIHRATPGDGALQRWIAGEQLPYPNGLALAGGHLYVAHATGIARIDVDSGEIEPRLANATREAATAIDGLYAHAGTLIGVQNWTHPGRVMQYVLADDGRSITAARTLQSQHHADVDEPTTAAISGDRVLVLANSQIAALQPDGTLRDAGTLRAPVVLAVKLR